MTEKSYPIYLVSITHSTYHFKFVHNAEEYAAFCTTFVTTESVLREIKSIEAIYNDRMKYIYSLVPKDL